MHLMIRVDGDSTIGYGHLVRTNALAEEALSRGHQVSVATSTSKPARSVFPSAVDIAVLSSRDDPRPFVGLIDTNQSDAVFTDSYVADTEYQRAVRDQVPLAVLQDDARHAVCADLFTNGNLYAPNLDYEFVGSKPKTCLGSDYVLLRREIRELAQENPPWRDEPERAIIIMGGSDIKNLTPTVMRAFDGYDIHVDAIVGPGVSKQQEDTIRTTARDISTEVSVLRDPGDLPERMFHADFAVSTSSSTTYELLALGTPIVSIPVADNQEPIAEALRDHNAATVLERTPGIDDIRRAIKKYATDSTLREKRRERGRELVDGRGVERMCPELLSLAKKD